MIICEVGLNHFGDEEYSYKYVNDLMLTKHLADHLISNQGVWQLDIIKTNTYGLLYTKLYS